MPGLSPKNDLSRGRYELALLHLRFVFAYDDPSEVVGAVEPLRDRAHVDLLGGFVKDYYRILRVHPEADDYTVKAAYRRLAQEFHPDVSTDPSAAQQMAAVNEANEVLSEPVPAIQHFQRVVEIDPNGDAGIEASKELLRLGVLGAQQGCAGASPSPAPIAPTPPGSIATPQGLLNGAGFGLRVGAALIDSLASLIIYAFALAFGAAAHSTAFGVFAFLLGSFAYFAGMESSKYQGTLGKMALGLRVCDLNGQPIRVELAIAKHALRLVNSLTGVICLGYIGWLLVAFTPKKQTAYELAVGAVTVVGRPSII